MLIYFAWDVVAAHLNPGLQRVVRHAVLGHLHELHHSLLQPLLSDHGFSQAAVDGLDLLVLVVHLRLCCQQLAVELCAHACTDIQLLCVT